MQLFFALTLLVSATLLFVVQPMFAKMALPLLGGTPAVWNTCMVFYQAVLLVGYIYAHISIRFLGPRRQAALHMVVLCLPWLVLPIGISGAWVPPSDADPTGWLLLLLLVSVGLPFFVVSSSAPMLQAWFADTGHADAGDPYFLYAASNLGSMAALLGYPVLLEPTMTLALQSSAWAGGYALLMLLLAGCAILLWRSRRPSLQESVREEISERKVHLAAAPTLGKRLWWVALSFAPSSLLLGVTTHISTDLASVPLLWVIPLALYLLTFVLVFARRQLLPHAWMVRAQPYFVIPLAALFFLPVSQSIWIVLLLHLATFFVLAMVCHGELAASRPAAKYLTEFYLWMSIGGVLGGLFNAMVAPQLFPTILEYPLVIALACMLRPWLTTKASERHFRRQDVLAPLGVALVFGGAAFGLQFKETGPSMMAVLVLLAGAGAICFSFQNRPRRFGLGVGAVLVTSLFCSGQQTNMLHTERNFFGVLRVKYDPRLNTNILIHGLTNHGMQSRDPSRRDQPMNYFHPTGPIGQVFENFENDPSKKEIGIIGLGIGALACYGREDQRITYYEIDPAVERLARDTRYFTFLENSKADIDVILGDARLKLADAPRWHYDLLIFDAFSSDAIPIHLITREALGLYLEKLAEHGVLALHISNYYVDLKPVLGNLARDAGVVCRIQEDLRIAGEQRREGKSPSVWVVMARRSEDLSGLLDDPRWKPLPQEPAARLWTDNFSNILGVIKWH